MSDGEPWQVYVIGMEALVCTINVAQNEDEFIKTTIIQFRRLLEEKWSEAKDCRLLFTNKQLENETSDGKEATFETYNIQRNSTIHMVIRLPGGQDSQLMPKFTDRVPKPPVVEKEHDLCDYSLKFTTTEPDAIMGTSEVDDQPRVKMSCGHAVDANSLTAWCRSLLEQHEFEFHCPAITDGKTKKCKKIWPYEEVRRVALLNEAEQQYFESKISEYAASTYCDMKECPGCRSFVERSDLNNLRVHCTVCTRKKGRNYDFCWHCNNEWTGPTTSSVKCGRDKCEHPFLPALRKAPMVTLIKKIKAPSRRACPTCGFVVEHSTDGCKIMTCRRCKKEFCFLCLELKSKCFETAPWSYFEPCSKEPAGRQTVIPVWSRQK